MRAWRAVTMLLALSLLGCAGQTAPSLDVLAPTDTVAARDEGGELPGPPTFESSAHITDEQGRVLVFHGINVMSAAKSDPQRIPRIDETDARRIARDWGFDFVRFLIFWDAIEPAPGLYDQGYLDLVEEKLDLLWAEGLRVMLDMHQDVYAARFCCDGAPEWAIRDDGLDFELQSQWFMNYFQPAVQRAFDNFWDHDGPHADLQEHYAGAWLAVVERLGDHPAVIGYDLMNEPHPGSALDAGELLAGVANPDGPHMAFDREKLQPFYQRLIDRIRQIDTERWIFFEPRYGAPGLGMPSYMGLLTDPRPGAARLAYAPHLYSLKQEASGVWDPENDATLVDWEASRREELAAQPMPMLIGEWGLDWNTENVEDFMGGVLALAERMGAGWAYWSYDPGGWGLWNADGSERPAAAILTRVHPRAVAGVPISFGYEARTREFELVFEDRAGIEGPTEIHLPAGRLYPDGWRLSVSDPEGTWSQSWDAEREILSVRTPPQPGTRHTIRITPAGLRLMSFNLRTMFGDDGEDMWPNRRTYAAETVRAAAPDLLGTQEGSWFQLEDLASLLPEYRWSGISRQGDNSDEFCAIFWRPERFELLEEETFWLSDTPEVVASRFSEAQGWTRIVTWLRLRPLDGGAPFVVANTHFDTTNADDIPARSAALCVERFGERDEPVFLMGDFNESPADLSWRILTGADEWEGVRGDFIDPWPALGLPEQGTYHRFTGESSGARIDWILARNGPIPVDAEVVTTDFEGRYPSDHFPVTATFALP